MIKLRYIWFHFFIVELVGKDSDVLSKLEMEYEVQKQITKAKLKLSTDETIPKNVRKKHKENHSKAHSKVSDHYGLLLLRERLMIIELPSYRR